MMQRVLTKYGLVAHVACLCLFSLYSLVSPHERSSAPLLWLSLAAAEMMFLLPSLRRNETLADARQRVSKALAWDPFLYIGLALVGVAASQWLNSGCELSYLPDADIWQLNKPPLAWMPFSVSAAPAFSRLSLLVACVLVAVILRAALSKTSKRILLQVLACAAGLLAVCLVSQACLKVQPVYAQTSGVVSPAYGAFFGFWLLMSMGLLADALARYQRSVVALFVLGFIGNFCGMLFFANVMAGAVYVVLTLLLIVYWMVYLSPHIPKHKQLQLFLLALLVIVVAGFSIFFLFPNNPVAEKIKAALPLADYWQSLAATRRIRTEAAMRVWQDHPWIGVGADGYYHFVGMTVKAADWPLIKVDQAAVYNDSVQFLCEYGVLGIGLLLAAVVSLMVPICYRARIAWKYGTLDENDGRAYLVRISPIVLVGVLATGRCFAESWISNPFRLSGLLLSWVCVMAAMPAFLPASEGGGSPK